LDGILLLDKPRGWTSHDAVDFLRNTLRIKKAGHAGTLDPMATGLLVMLLGRATKLSAELTGLDKDYRGTIRLGTVTDSWDLEGKVLAERPVQATPAAIEAAVAKLNGKILITPPSFSALKKDGKRYYELARKGVMLEPPTREVQIDDFHVTSFVSPEVAFFVRCSKGTYIRSLAHQLGAALGCGGCLSSLERTRIGEFHLKDAISVEAVKASSSSDIQKRLLRAQ
jgi:tRNA pseudouridine55 synthase